MKYSILITWIIASTILDIFLFGGTAYLIFYKGISIWWFVAAIILSVQPTLYKILRKEFHVSE